MLYPLVGAKRLFLSQKLLLPRIPNPPVAMDSSNGPKLLFLTQNQFFLLNLSDFCMCSPKLSLRRIDLYSFSGRKTLLEYIKTIKFRRKPIVCHYILITKRIVIIDQTSLRSFQLAYFGKVTIKSLTIASVFGGNTRTGSSFFTSIALSEKCQLSLNA